MKPLGSKNDDSEDGSDIDYRLYMPYPEGWKAHVKVGWDKSYCYAKHPGEDYFHLIMSGEIYLESGHEMYCLTCAMRQGLLTQDRLNWQKTPSKEDRKRL